MSHEVFEKAIREVADEWVFGEYRSKSQRTFAASVVRVALRGAFNMTVQKDVFDLMEQEAKYKRVMRLVWPDFAYLCAEVQMRLDE